MRPSIIIPVDDLPRGQTGKMDRKTIARWALPSQGNGGHYRTDLTLEIGRMRELWVEVISPEVISGYSISSISDFFHVGGNSLLLVNLQRRINATYRTQVSLVQLFESSTLGRMTGLVSEYIDQGSASIDWDEETEPPSVEPSRSLRGPASPAEVIVLSGATGHLGRELLSSRLPAAHRRHRRLHGVEVGRRAPSGACERAIRSPRRDPPPREHRARRRAGAGPLPQPAALLLAHGRHARVGQAAALPQPSPRGVLRAGHLSGRAVSRG